MEQFFKQLNGRVIIFITDEEIVGDYCNVISDIVSTHFVLNHTINGNTEILSDTYFWAVYDEQITHIITDPGDIYLLGQSLGLQPLFYPKLAIALSVEKAKYHSDDYKTNNDGFRVG